MPDQLDKRYFRKHVLRIQHRSALVDSIYNQTTRRLLSYAKSVQPIEGKTFSFDDFPAIKNAVGKIFANHVASLEANVMDGIKDAWYLSNQKNDALVDLVYGKSKIPKDKLSGYMNKNLDALLKFQNRKEQDGLTLSKRVWKYGDQFRSEIELSLTEMIGSGKSTEDMVRQIQQNLKYPDKLFHRIRNSKGELEASSAFKGFNPGQGVYKSSYKNSMRLVRNEMNKSFLDSDYTRYQQLDFIVGYEVVLSSGHTIVDICDTLKGRYPKTFKFTGWHVQDMCHVIAIMYTEKEFNETEGMLLNGEDISNFKSENEVVAMPEGFTKWTKDNQERSQKWKRQPDFIRDNFKEGRLEGGLKMNL